MRFGKIIHIASVIYPRPEITLDIRTMFNIKWFDLKGQMYVIHSVDWQISRFQGFFLHRSTFHHTQVS